MHQHTVVSQKVSIALAAAVLAAAFATAAAAATHPRPVTPNDTQEWGNEIVRVTADDPGSLSVGPSGASLQTGSDGGSDTSSLHGAPGAAPADINTTADYCLEFDLADSSSGPYRVSFFFDTSGGDSESAVRRSHVVKRKSALRRAKPQDDTTLTLTFELDTNADGTVITTGDSDLLGAIYDADDDLVGADDDSGDRISATLATGSYTLVLSGGDELGGAYVVTAGLGSCDD
jgi:hypothetical protein